MGRPLTEEKLVASEARNRRRSSGHRAALALRAAAFLSSERRDELVAALNRLAENDRQAIAFRYFLVAGRRWGSGCR